MAFANHKGPNSTKVLLVSLVCFCQFPNLAIGTTTALKTCAGAYSVLKRTQEDVWVGPPDRGLEEAQQFDITNRTFDELVDDAHDFGAGAFYRLRDLKGKNLLDIGAGKNGWMVRDLRRLGVNAFGVDIIAERQSGLVRARPEALPFASGSMDFVYSHYSIFWDFYSSPSDVAFRRKAFDEIMRVLKPNGSFRTGPNNEVMIAEIQRFAADYPGSRVRVLGSPGNQYIEVRKAAL